MKFVVNRKCACAATEDEDKGNGVENAGGLSISKRIVPTVEHAILDGQ